MTKRNLALLLALAMVFSVLPTGYALDGGSTEPEESAGTDAHIGPEEEPAAAADPAGTDAHIGPEEETEARKTPPAERGTGTLTEFEPVPDAPPGQLPDAHPRPDGRADLLGL